MEVNGGMPPNCRVFVGNLDTKVTWKILKDNMQAAGEVVRVEIMKDSRGNSKGCAIVIYSSALEAQRAIQQMHEVELFGKPMHLREDLPVKRRHSRSRSPRHMSRVYVSNLPYSATSIQITQAFKKFGRIDKVEVPKDRHDRPKGYCYIYFGANSEAETAVREMGNSSFEGRIIEVSMAS